MTDLVVGMAAHPIDYRYGSQEMRAVWDENSRLENYLKVEAALVRALAALGRIPPKDAQEIAGRASPEFVTLERVKEIEGEIKHDVMAVVKALREQCGEEAGRYVHATATSYDIVDTAQALQLKDSLEIILRKAALLLAVLLEKSVEHKKTVMAGRTHGQHALPITLGFKLANYAEKLGTSLRNLKWERENLVQGKFSGAVGTYSAQKEFGISGGELEKAVMEELGVSAAPISTQVVARENHALIVCDLAVLAGTLEQIAKEVRNLQRTEIAEVGEAFGEKQVGSSTMAQKRNPVDCENVCGNARVVRSLAAPALENIALEHERDLTNSAAERSILPTAFLLLDDMLERMNRIMAGLEVFPERMKRNLELTKGAIMSEAVITALVKKGVGRQEAHELLRTSSARAREKDVTLRHELEGNPLVKTSFSPAELGVLFDYSNYLGYAEEKTDEIVGKWRSQLREWGALPK